MPIHLHHMRRAIVWGFLLTACVRPGQPSGAASPTVATAGATAPRALTDGAEAVEEGGVAELIFLRRRLDPGESKTLPALLAAREARRLGLALVSCPAGHEGLIADIQAGQAAPADATDIATALRRLNRYTVDRHGILYADGEPMRAFARSGCRVHTPLMTGPTLLRLFARKGDFTLKRHLYQKFRQRGGGPGYFTPAFVHFAKETLLATRLPESDATIATLVGSADLAYGHPAVPSLTPALARAWLAEVGAAQAELDGVWPERALQLVYDNLSSRQGHWQQLALELDLKQTLGRGVSLSERGIYDELIACVLDDYPLLRRTFALALGTGLNADPMLMSNHSRNGGETHGSSSDPLEPLASPYGGFDLGDFTPLGYRWPSEEAGAHPRALQAQKERLKALAPWLASP